MIMVGKINQWGSQGEGSRIKYKLLATDLDDSLLDSNLVISERDREAVWRASAAGVKVVLATGRMYRSALPYAKNLDLDTPMITYQGAYVRFPEGRVLYHQPVPLELALEVLELVRPLGYPVNIYIDDRLLVDRITELSREYQAISGVEPEAIGDPAEFLVRQGLGPTKLLVMAEEHKLDILRVKLVRLFKDRLYITKSKPKFLEFTHPAATKGRALKVVAGYYGISATGIIAVGDSYNDLDMLDYAGLGVAVANAREAVKTRAGYVTGSPSGGALCEVIGKFIFNGEVQAW